MTEADILATTYEDTVTVYRAFKDTLPGGESVFKSGLDGKAVYVMLAPWMFGFLLMWFIPMLISIYYSFTNFNLLMMQRS